MHCNIVSILARKASLGMRIIIIYFGGQLIHTQTPDIKNRKKKLGFVTRYAIPVDLLILVSLCHG